jgi:hypothetical protein
LKSTSECIDDEWRPNPAPTATIQSTNGEKWDHINDTADSIPLGLSNPEDKDDKCVDCQWETQPDNYIEEDDTEWEWSSGEGYCSPTTGSTTNWYATSTAQPTWVKAKLIDSSSNPDPDADDDDEWTDTYTDLHGFKVGVRAKFNGVWEGNSGTIWEGGSYSYSTATSGEINAYSRGVSSPGEDEDSTYFYVSFEYKTQPSDAEPAGDVKADLEFGLDADWAGYVSDCDLVDQGASVSIGFDPGAFGIGGSFGYTWDLDDGEEGIGSGDWAYMTNEGLGAQRTPSGDPLFVYESGDYPDIPIQLHWFDHSEDLRRSATKEWEKGDQVKGQYDISCATYATDHCSQDVGRSDCFLTNPIIKIEDIGYSP